MGEEATVGVAVGVGVGVGEGVGVGVGDGVGVGVGFGEQASHSRPAEFTATPGLPTILKPRELTKLVLIMV